MPGRDAAALRPHLAGLQAYDLCLDEPSVHRGLPSTGVTVVLPLDRPLDVGWSGLPTSRERRWSTVSGLHTQPAQIHQRGRERGVQLTMTMTGARALLGVPAAELAHGLHRIEEVCPALADLPERLADAPDLPTATDMVVAELLRVLDADRARAQRPEVGHALASLSRGAGVEQVAREVGYSRRHLGALVRAECGLAPKQLQQVARFTRSRRALVSAAARGWVDLARLAHEGGYADQAHLTREWSRLAGCGPRTWLREELRFVQDPGVAGAQTGEHPRGEESR